MVHLLYDGVQFGESCFVPNGGGSDGHELILVWDRSGLLCISTDLRSRDRKTRQFGLPPEDVPVRTRAAA